MTPRKADPDAIAAAAAALRAGKLVAFPTETVYGLGADATNGEAVAAIYEAKGRPAFNPLIIHVPDRQAAETIVAFTEAARAVADAFWPGPLTLVLPRRKDCPVSLLAGAGLDTLAVRVPAHDVALALLREAACPVAAPSANPSGEVSPTDAAPVAAALGDAVSMVLDGGRCTVGLESTVLDLTGELPAILRHGGATVEDIAAITGTLAESGTGAEDDPRPASPGRLARHYATRKPLRMKATKTAPDEALLGFGPDAPTAALNLSPTGDLREAAANLFAMMRALDDGPGARIAVMPVPEHGLGRAINDRLRRAAHD
jgi:L-threonylcarbamoyladenylate synthase